MLRFRPSPQFICIGLLAILWADVLVGRLLYGMFVDMGHDVSYLFLHGLLLGLLAALTWQESAAVRSRYPRVVRFLSGFLGMNAFLVYRDLGRRHLVIIVAGLVIGVCAMIVLDRALVHPDPRSES